MSTRISAMRRLPEELFRLRVECANQARQFEADWRGHITAYDIESSVFRNHYNEADGHCYIDILSRSDFGEREWVMDATEGIASQSIVWRNWFSDPKFRPDERDRSSEHDDALTEAKIQRLMGDGPSAK